MTAPLSYRARWLPCALILVLAGACASSAHAQESAPADSLLPTGTAARFWTPRHGWKEGILARIFPTVATRCLGVVSDEIGGIVTLAHIDSLQVDTAAANVREVRQAAEGAHRIVPPLWRTVSLQLLLAREPDCTL
jgi:hypothetical protein